MYILYFRQWRSKDMANCAYAKGANCEGVQNYASKLVLIFIFPSKRDFFIIHFEMSMILSICTHYKRLTHAHIFRTVKLRLNSYLTTRNGACVCVNTYEHRDYRYRIARGPSIVYNNLIFKSDDSAYCVLYSCTLYCNRITISWLSNVYLIDTSHAVRTRHVSYIAINNF